MRNLIQWTTLAYEKRKKDDDDDDRLGSVLRAIVSVNARSWNDEVVVRTRETQTGDLVVTLELTINHFKSRCGADHHRGQNAVNSRQLTTSPTAG